MKQSCRVDRDSSLIYRLVSRLISKVPVRVRLSVLKITLSDERRRQCRAGNSRAGMVAVKVFIHTPVFIWAKTLGFFSQTRLAAILTTMVVLCGTCSTPCQDTPYAGFIQNAHSIQLRISEDGYVSGLELCWFSNLWVVRARYSN
jgi:hypothetical protein